MLVRFLLIIPTVFILVTLVFFLMRLDRRPDHGGTRRPAAGRPARRSASTRPATTGRSSCSTSSTSGRCSPATSARRSPTTAWSPRCSSRYGAATLELVVLRADRRARRRHPARAWSPPPRATTRRTPCSASARSSSTRRRCSSPASLLKLIFSVWLGWLPVARSRERRAPRSRSIARARTGIYLIDAIALRQPGRTCSDVLLHAVLPGDRARSARPPASSCAWSAPTSSARSACRYVDAARSRGVSEYRLVTQARLQARADPDHHGDRTADRAAARRRRAHRDDLRVEGPRLPARRSTSPARDFVAVQGIVVAARGHRRARRTSSSTSSPR